MQRPDTRYAKSGSVHIAYQVAGSGPLDLVLTPGFISNLDLHWEEPGYAHLLRRLATFARVIQFDKRGTGLSDRDGGVPTLEQRMDDIRAVMDAVPSKRATIFGASEGGAMAMLFAATYPRRVRALVLYGSYAHFHSWVLSPQQLASFIANVETTWGTGSSLASFAPSRQGDAAFAQWWARYERQGAGPNAVIALADRVTFTVAAAKEFPGDSYDLITCFDCLHDMGDPAGAAAHLRTALAPDGTWMIVEPFANDRLEDNLNPVGSIYYAGPR